MNRLALAVLFVLALPAVAQELVPVRYPDLAPLEKSVAEQIGGLESDLRSLLAEPKPDLGLLATVYSELGQVYHVYGLAAPAEDCYRNAEQLLPGDFRWPHLLAALLQKEGKLDEAAAAWDRALEMEPDDVPALVHRGEILILQGKPEEAVPFLQKALKLDPKSTAAKAQLGQAALARRDFPEAVKHLEAALAESPEANRLHHPLAMAYRGLDNRTKAGEHLAKAGAVGVRPADPLVDGIQERRTGERVHLIRGRIAYRAGRPAEALAEFKKAVEAKPGSVEGRINLGSALVLTGDKDGAIAQYREALKLDAESATAHFNLALLLADQGELPEATSHMAAVVAKRPEDGEARLTLARLLRDGGREEEALAEYAKAVELTPGDETARLGQAETLVRLGKYKEARQSLEESLALLPASGRLSHGLARLLAACPDPSVRDGARALDLAKTVWSALPASGHAETVALALAELGRCEEAAEWQREAIAAARKEGVDPGRLAQALVGYEKGAPCRPR
ncbi:MAG TPA: tetratricopeptide repeat protein [Thermoanaerobaculia bacterium]